MSNETTPSRLAEAQHLTATLCDQVLDAQIMNQHVPPERIVALVKAARLLQDHGIEWPPMLAQALHGLIGTDDVNGAQIEQSDAGENAGSTDVGNPVVQSLSRLVGAFRRDRAS